MDEVEKKLTEDQFTAVRMHAKELRILAGAGTGKTRVLTNRIAYQTRALRIDPQHSLCLTFNKRAAVELQSRLMKLGLGNFVTVGTFHAIALAQLQARWKDLRINSEPTLLSNREKFLFEIIPNSLSPTERTFIFNEINWCTAQRVSPNNYQEVAEKSGRRSLVHHSSISEHYRKFVELKKQRNLLDFDDILEQAIKFLTEDTQYADARHWKYQDLFVDEFQDVNPLQFALLRSWLGANSSLCVVGDPNQAIYSWNGADSSFLNDFSGYFPEAETVRLRQNFRSTPEILSVSSLLLASDASLFANKPNGPLPTIQSHDNELIEAKNIADRILQKNSESMRWGDQAVLVRTHSQIAVITGALDEKEIPYSIQTEVKDANNNRSSEAVKILTFHASKGLEWKVVHISGLEDGLVPIAHAVSQSERDEERRLLYVALTRAEDEIHLSWSRNRRFGSNRERKPSIFLKELISALNQSPKPTLSQTPKELAKKIRDFRSQWRADHLIEPEDFSYEERLNLLRELRSSIARVNDTSPENILSDAVLEELIEEMPDSMEKLVLISGLSPSIISRFGGQILELLSED